MNIYIYDKFIPHRATFEVPINMLSNDLARSGLVTINIYVEWHNTYGGVICLGL